MRHLLLVLLLSVTPAFAADSDANSSQAGAVALAFINGYAKATFARDWNPQKWVATSPLVTDNFKRTLKKMIADGFRKDPELGLGADPVIDGQDCPERFTLKSVKASGDTADIVVVGPKDFPMQVKMRAVREDGKWLVDASGMMLR